MLDIIQVVFLGVAVIVGYLVCVPVKHDPREPPVVHSSIPVIGHFIGLIRYGSSYFSMLVEKNPGPAWTVNLVLGKTYIFAAPSLVSAVQRNHKVITLEPILDAVLGRLLSVDRESQRTMSEKQISTGRTLSMDILIAMHDTLVGPGLDNMNKRIIVRLKEAIDKLDSKAGTPFDLVAWCRDDVAMHSSEAVWGSSHPFRSKAVQDAFWEFDVNLAHLIVNFLPRFTARSAWKARNQLVAAFVEYYESGGLQDASELAKLRWNRHRDAGLSIEDVAKLEVGLTLGVFSNTGIMAFWMLFDLCSRPDLLEAVRNEVRQNALHIEGTKCTIDFANISDFCPLTVATFQESLRLHACSTPLRCVAEDILLNDQYLLKKGSMVQISSVALHHRNDTWGNNPTSFDATRFRKGITREKDARKVGGFLGFGISPHICPGRHFATGQILAVASALILRFDVRPVSEKWLEPRPDLKRVVPAVTPPVEAFNVTVIPRDEYKEFEWDFRVKEGKSKVPLVIG